MPQQQCPWCNRLGPRYAEGSPPDTSMAAHSDGSKCVCRHVTAGTRLSAAIANGRYFDRSADRYVCFACGTARVTDLDHVRAHERGFEL